MPTSEFTARFASGKLTFNKAETGAKDMSTKAATELAESMVTLVEEAQKAGQLPDKLAQEFNLHGGVNNRVYNVSSSGLRGKPSEQLEKEMKAYGFLQLNPLKDGKETNGTPIKIDLRDPEKPRLGKLDILKEIAEANHLKKADIDKLADWYQKTHPAELKKEEPAKEKNQKSGIDPDTLKKEGAVLNRHIVGTDTNAGYESAAATGLAPGGKIREL